MMITSFLVDLPNAIESIDLCRMELAILSMSYISTSVWRWQHPNAGRNIQHINDTTKYSKTGSGMSKQTEVHDSFQTIQEKLNTEGFIN